MDQLLPVAPSTSALVSQTTFRVVDVYDQHDHCSMYLLHIFINITEKPEIVQQQGAAESVAECTLEQA
jgi:hypothetical protein